MIYPSVKFLHVAAVLTTIVLFCLRAYWRAAASPRLAQRWVRVFPHVVDTVLLVSGIWLAWQLGTAAWRGWLPAKLFGLAAYIVLGTIALRRGRTPAIRLAATALALASLAYIVAVALTKTPLPGLPAPA